MHTQKFFEAFLWKQLIISAQIQQNGQTHSSNPLAFADELFEGVGRRLKG